METPTAERFLVRPATMDDLQAVVKLINAWSLHYTGVEETDEDELRSEWDYPPFDLATSSRMVLTPEGQLVGYADIWDNASVPVNVGIFIRVHPNFEDQGIETMLLDWIEVTAQRVLSRVPAEARVTLRSGILSTAEPIKRIMEARGMEIVRHFYEMRRDFDGPPPTPQWPEGITLRQYVRGQDERIGFKALKDAFQDHFQ
jgi:GNAT superfamily N-acetyltransferase